MWMGSDYEDLFQRHPGSQSNSSGPAWRQFIPRRPKEPRKQPARVEKPASRTCSPQGKGLVRRRTTHASHSTHVKPQRSPGTVPNSHPSSTPSTQPRPASWHPSSMYPNFMPEYGGQPFMFDPNFMPPSYAPSGIQHYTQDDSAFGSISNQPMLQALEFADYTQLPPYQPGWQTSNDFYNPATFPDQAQPHYTLPETYHLSPFGSFDGLHSGMHQPQLPTNTWFQDQDAKKAVTQDEQQAETGGDLVGMGLYDRSDNMPHWTTTAYVPPFPYQHQEPISGGKGLKLEEAWQPSSSNPQNADADADADAEGDNDGACSSDVASLVDDDAESQRQPSFEHDRFSSFDSYGGGAPTESRCTLPSTLTDAPLYYGGFDTHVQQWYHDGLKEQAPVILQPHPWFAAPSFYHGM